jgi:uncharacterized protein YegP (UPF0339 family)
MKRRDIFEWWKMRNGKFRYHRKAANGEILHASQPYTRKDNAMRAIRREGGTDIREVRRK